MTSIPLAAGLAAALSYGIADFLSARSAKVIGAIQASVVVNLVGAVLYEAWFFIRQLTDPVSITTSWAGIGYAAAAGFVLACGSLAFFRGLEAGPVSIVVPLGSLYPLVMVVVGWIVFGEVLGAGQVFAIVMIVLGGMLAAGLLNAKHGDRKLTAGPRWALAVGLLWGVGFTMLNQAVERLGWQFTSAIQFAVIAVTLLALLPLVKGNEVINRHTLADTVRNVNVLGAAVISTLGGAAVNFGMHHEAGSGAIVTAVSACYPLITVLLALRHFSEKVQAIPLFGAVVGIGGVVMLSVL